MPPGSMRGLVIDCDDLDADYTIASVAAPHPPPSATACAAFS
jgi:hypothetical protein